MSKSNTNDGLLKEAKAVLQRIGLPVIQEKISKDSWGLSTGVIHFDGGPGEIIKVTYTNRTQYILISDTLAWPVSGNKITFLPEIINKLNSVQAGATFYFDEERHVVEVGRGFWVSSSTLDEVTFEKNLGYVMKMGERLFPVLLDFLADKRTKQDIFSKINTFKMEAERNEETHKKNAKK